LFRELTEETESTVAETEASRGQRQRGDGAETEGSWGRDRGELGQRQRGAIAGTERRQR
jgi:hypothetical protein